ncbi:CDC42 small effector protein 1-like [Salvelinus fontinalis]|uniref:CDC42 small effector protein 1-like n=1 Tax=Salvelinus fontinalis TaxID=8038 RepID=UPI002485886E|nr:CDC42 small effector protein 1-like [Salvelinus fontinalis]
MQGATFLFSTTSSAACRASREKQGLRTHSEQSSSTAGMSEFWNKIGCCVVAKPPPRKRRRKIDRSMIGEPTNFVHLTHIGSGEMAEGRAPALQYLRQWKSRETSIHRRFSEREEVTF